jgi:NDP-sugar pyrophosphorylase family protein
VARQGFSRIILAMELMPEQIESYLRDGRRWDIELDYVLLPRRLGDAGALKWSQSKLNGPCVVMSANMLLDLELPSLVEKHCESGNLATVLVHTREHSQPIYATENGHMSGLKEGTTCRSATGVYVFNPTVLDYVPYGQNFDIYNHLLPALHVSRQPVGVVETSGYWNPLSTYCDFHEAQQAFLRSNEALPQERGALGLPRHPELNAIRYAEGIWVGPENAIHPEALLTPPVYIGARCQIGKGVELGPHAYIGSDVIIDAAATIHNSTILDRTYVGELVNVEGYIVAGHRVIDVHSGEEVAVTDDFLFAALDGERMYRDLGRPLEAAVALLLLGLAIILLLPLMILLLLVNGRIFQAQPYVVALDEVDPARDRKVRLLHLGTRRSDGRTNVIDRFVEAWELHRLPELWNVVRGEIKLVGVTPLTLQEADRVELFWRMSRRGRVAGFTGLWYVQAAPEGELDERMAADAFYMATHDRWKDLVLLLRSPLAWWRQIKSAQFERNVNVQGQVV